MPERLGPVVFLPGWLGSPKEWDPVRSCIDPSCSTLALPVSAARDWAAGIEQLGARLPRQCVLVGYSLGARVALGCAVANPSQVRALCLLSGHPGLEHEDERVSRAAHDQALQQRLRTQPLETFLDQWYRQPVFASVDEPTRQRWTRERLELNRHEQAELLRCYSLARQPNYWPALPRLPMPCQMIVGRHDPKYVAIGRCAQSLAPKLQLKIIAGAGHAVHRQQPQPVAALLQDFIAFALGPAQK